MSEDALSGDPGPQGTVAPVPGGYRVRPLRVEDLPGVIAIEREAFSTPWSAQTFESLLGRPPWVLLVLEACGGACPGVAGYAVLGCVMEQGELANIAVGGNHRGAGLGGMLLDRVIEEAGSRGGQQLYLEVRASNTAAAALYRSRGFEEIGVRRNYYESPREDARVLVRHLDVPPADAG